MAIVIFFNMLGRQLAKDMADQRQQRLESSFRNSGKAEQLK